MQPMKGARKELSVVGMMSPLLEGHERTILGSSAVAARAQSSFEMSAGTESKNNEISDQDNHTTKGQTRSG